MHLRTHVSFDQEGVAVTLLGCPPPYPRSPRGPALALIDVVALVLGCAEHQGAADVGAGVDSSGSTTPDGRAPDLHRVTGLFDRRR